METGIFAVPLIVLCGCRTLANSRCACDSSLFVECQRSRDLRGSLPPSSRSLSWCRVCGHILAEIESLSRMSASAVRKSRKRRERGAELPEEVLRRVFTDVRNRDAGTKDLLSLMVVCRRFAVSTLIRLA
jgi:hypothetical protein